MQGNNVNNLDLSDDSLDTNNSVNNFDDKYDSIPLQGVSDSQTLMLGRDQDLQLVPSVKNVAQVYGDLSTQANQQRQGLMKCDEQSANQIIQNLLSLAAIAEKEAEKRSTGMYVCAGLIVGGAALCALGSSLVSGKKPGWTGLIVFGLVLTLAGIVGFSVSCSQRDQYISNKEELERKIQDYSINRAQMLEDGQNDMWNAMRQQLGTDSQLLRIFASAYDPLDSSHLKGIKTVMDSYNTRSKQSNQFRSLVSYSLNDIGKGKNIGAN